jgi:hypothetical protein
MSLTFDTSSLKNLPAPSTVEEELILLSSGKAFDIPNPLSIPAMPEITIVVPS